MLGFKVAAIVAVIGITSSLICYNLGVAKGAKQARELAEARCDAFIKDWQSKIIQMSNEHIRRVNELNDELDKVKADNEVDANRLRKKIGELRAASKFVSNPQCTLSDDELRQLQSAYTVRTDSGSNQG
jgi:hypothetical protein